MIAPQELTISDEAFAYLKIQRGAISDLSNDRKAWEAAYRRSLLGDFGTMQRWLPEKCGAILDVGSGLGGINILFARHYGNNPSVWLLDGIEDEPRVERHDATFNSAPQACIFLATNGLFTAMPIGPASLPEVKVPDDGFFDLVVSVQAWCFHFPPSEYLDFVKRSAMPGATLILDVRKGRDDWRKELSEAFTEIGVAVSPPKFDRVVYRNDRP